MAVLVSKASKISLEDTTTEVTVPNDDIANLMYYLHCINCCLQDFEPNPQWQRLLDYKRSYELNESEKQLVVLLCGVLSPQKLLGLVIFALPDNHPSFDGFSNRFYKITEASHVLAAGACANTTVVVEEQNVKIAKFMTFKSFWLRKHYINPMQSQMFRITQGETDHRHSNYSSRYSSSSFAPSLRERFVINERPFYRRRHNKRCLAWRRANKYTKMGVLLLILLLVAGLALTGVVLFTMFVQQPCIIASHHVTKENHVFTLLNPKSGKEQYKIKTNDKYSQPSSFILHNGEIITASTKVGYASRTIKLFHLMRKRINNWFFSDFSEFTTTSSYDSVFLSTSGNLLYIGYLEKPNYVVDKISIQLPTKAQSVATLSANETISMIQATEDYVFFISSNSVHAYDQNGAVSTQDIPCTNPKYKGITVDDQVENTFFMAYSCDNEPRLFYVDGKTLSQIRMPLWNGTTEVQIVDLANGQGDNKYNLVWCNITTLNCFLNHITYLHSENTITIDDSPKMIPLSYTNLRSIEYDTDCSTPKNPAQVIFFCCFSLITAHVGLKLTQPPSISRDYGRYFKIRVHGLFIYGVVFWDMLLLYWKM